MRNSYSTSWRVRNTGLHRLPGEMASEDCGEADPRDPRLADSQDSQAYPIAVMSLGIPDKVPWTLSAEAMEQVDLEGLLGRIENHASVQSFPYPLPAAFRKPCCWGEDPAEMRCKASTLWCKEPSRRFFLLSLAANRLPQTTLCFSCAPVLLFGLPFQDSWSRLTHVALSEMTR